MADQRTRNIAASILLLLMGVGGLVWHEIAYFRNKSASSHMEECVVLDSLPSKVDPALEGKLVYMSGVLNTRDVFKDPFFGVYFRVLRLKTVREYYQVRETEHKSPAKTPDGRDTVQYSYTYGAEWVDHEVTAAFHDAEIKNENTVCYEAFKPASFDAENVHLGPYRISKDLLKELPDVRIPVPEISQSTKNEIVTRMLLRQSPGSSRKAVERAAAHYAPRLFRVKDNIVYVSLQGVDDEMNNPHIGDVRIRYMGVPRDTVSAIARIKDGVLVPEKYDKRPVTAIYWGYKSPQDVVQQFYQEFRGGTYATLRFILYLLIFFGLWLLLEKREHFMAKAPFFALAVFLFTMAIPWLFHKWYFGLLMLLGAGVSLFIYYYAFDRFYKMIAGLKKEVVDTETPTEVEIEPDNPEVETFDLE